VTCESLDASGGARALADQAAEAGLDAEAAGRMRRAAVVVHPGKHHDLVGFRAVVVNAMADLGWAAPLWLETSPDDTGERLAGEAVRSGVDLVIASGGDGTVIACASGVSGTGIPLGVLPSGTGNLLARNLGLPLDLDEALAIALTGAQRRLDVGVVNERPFVVMAGLGFDAEMIASAGEGLKRLAGWAAYAVSALRHLWDRPTRVVLRADGGPPLRRWASAVIVGNVGTLQGNVRLLPDAAPDDGVLDVAVLTAWGLLGWLGLAADVLLLRSKTSRLTRLTCRELVVDARRARPWEADGDVIGLARQLRVSVQAQSLLVRVPGRAGASRSGRSALPAAGVNGTGPS
jgi:YegS/Rv2252/BmrU family lipid kinase